jgi:hypothetical protein
MVYIWYIWYIHIDIFMDIHKLTCTRFYIFVITPLNRDLQRSSIIYTTYLLVMSEFEIAEITRIRILVVADPDINSATILGGNADYIHFRLL